MSKRFTVEGRMLFIVNKVPSEIKSNKQIRESMARKTYLFYESSHLEGDCTW